MSLVTIKVDNKEIKVDSSVIPVMESQFTGELIPKIKDNVVEVEGDLEFYQLLVRYYDMLHKTGYNRITEIKTSDLLETYRLRLGNLLKSYKIECESTEIITMEDKLRSVPSVDLDDILLRKYRMFERVQHFNELERETFSDYLIPLDTVEDRIKMIDKIVPMIDYARKFEDNLQMHLIIIVGDHILRPCTLREKDRILWNHRNNIYEPTPYEYGKGPILHYLKSENEIDAKQEECNQFLRSILETPIKDRYVIYVKEKETEKELKEGN